MTKKQIVLLSIAGSIASVVSLLLFFWPQSGSPQKSSPESNKQTITGETQGLNSPIINSQGDVSFTIEAKSPTTTSAYFLAKNYWLSKEPELLLTVSPREKRVLDLVRGTKVRIIEKKNITIEPFGEPHPVELAFVEVVGEPSDGIQGWVPFSMLEIRNQ